jgi:RNA polymerase sigma factor (sigma-70 family)
MEFTELFAGAARVAQRILGDRAAAEDVAAEACTRAYERGIESRAWVLRVAANLAIDATRRRVPVVAAAGGADVAEAVALRIALIDALRELPPRQREAVVLRYIAGLSQAEAAAAMGVSAGSVATHTHRGARALRGLLRSEPMKLSSLREAASLAGTGQVVEAQVTGRLLGPLWTVDAGIPAVLLFRDGEPSGVIDCVVAEVDGDRVLLAPGELPPVSLAIGERRTGRVHKLLPFGAFVDLGGAFGLLRSDGLAVGDELEVEVERVGAGVVVRAAR